MCVCSILLGPTIANSTVPLVLQLRQSYPTVPIVLAEGTPAGQAWIVASANESQMAARQALRAGYEKLKVTDANLYYVFGDDLYNITDDPNHTVSPTVGGCHPSGWQREEDLLFRFFNVNCVTWVYTWGATLCFNFPFLYSFLNFVF